MIAAIDANNIQPIINSTFPLDQIAAAGLQHQFSLPMSLLVQTRTLGRIRAKWPASPSGVFPAVAGDNLTDQLEVLVAHVGHFFAFSAVMRARIS